MTARGGLDIPRDRIFEMNASEKLKSINAYVTGIGASKRVVVWDTTLKTMTTGADAVRLRPRDGALRVAPRLARDRASWSGMLVLLYGTYHVAAQVGWRMDDYASLPALLLAMAVFDFVSDSDRELAYPHAGAQRRHLRPGGDPRASCRTPNRRPPRRFRSWARSGCRPVAQPVHRVLALLAPVRQ